MRGGAAKICTIGNRSIRNTIINTTTTITPNVTKVQPVTHFVGSCATQIIGETWSRSPGITACVLVINNHTVGCSRATRKTPAATIVAAWIRAEMGVGPCMASGSHTCRGNWAD